MTKFSTQYNSFLGGLVSPNCENRPDMEQYGRWFSKADNIRFKTIGSFENRPGFVKVATTKNNDSNEIIKLLSFSFNRDEAFLIEMGSGYFRVYKNKNPIVDADGKIKEFYSPFSFSQNDELKYAQSGDIIFLTNKKQGIYELRRLKTDGSEWEIKEFKFKDDCAPLGELNTDTAKNIKLESKTFDTLVANIYSKKEDDETFSGLYRDATLFFYGDAGVFRSIQIGPKENNILLSLQDIVDEINKYPSLDTFGFTVNAEAKGDNFILLRVGNQFLTTYNRIQLNYTFYKDYKTEVNSTSFKSRSLYSTLTEKYIKNVGFFEEIELYVEDAYKNVFPNLKTSYVFLKDTFESFVSGGKTLKDNIEWFNNELKSQTNNRLTIETTNMSGYINLRLKIDGNTQYGIGFKNIKESFPVAGYGDYVYPYKDGGDSFLASADFDFFANKSAGDVFAIKVKRDVQTIEKTLSPVTDFTSDEIKGSNNWRIVTSGNWTGLLKFQYRKEGETSWTTFKELRSYDSQFPINENAAGSFEGEDIINYKVVLTETTSGSDNRLNIFFETDSKEYNSYYKIVEKQTDSTAIVTCVKNNFGPIDTTPNWRESLFGRELGYPSCIGFYQNRLFFGKDYYLYGSRTNDFWDFYEPIDVADDDPVTMSILSYQVNDIKNIVTVRKFFVFTAGCEAGIASEGALTQASKYLIPLSMNGSADCDPVLAGNIILFVDSSANTVRMMQYSLETDAYEAADATFIIEQLLENEIIVQTGYLRNSKECLFLTKDGEIFVFKFFPEQNIMAWSKFKHAKYPITNICVVPNGYKDSFYITVKTETGKQIEVMDSAFYSDSVEEFKSDAELTQVQTNYQKGTKIAVRDSVGIYTQEVGENGVVSLLRPSKSVFIGLSYVSDATLLKPSVSVGDGTFTTYNIIKPFKVFFNYRNSYGFRVGIDGEELEDIDFQPTYSTIDEQTQLTTGQKSVFIQSGYDSSRRVRFLQEKPYPMCVENILLEVDYNGR